MTIVMMIMEFILVEYKKNNDNNEFFLIREIKNIWNVWNSGTFSYLSRLCIIYYETMFLVVVSIIFFSHLLSINIKPADNEEILSKWNKKFWCCVFVFSITIYNAQNTMFTIICHQKIFRLCFANSHVISKRLF